MLLEWNRCHDVSHRVQDPGSPVCCVPRLPPRPQAHVGTAVRQHPLGSARAKSSTQSAPDHITTASPLEEAKSLATEQVSWADGDVLRLRLSDGRHVYAEVLGPESFAPAQSRQLAKPSQRGLQGQGLGGGSLRLPASPQLLCQGGRYTLSRAAATAPGGEANSLTPTAEHAEAQGPTLELAGGAFLPNDSLLPLFASPPKQHAAALRAWTQLTSRLTAPAPPTQQRQQQPSPGQPGAGSAPVGAAVVRAEKITSLSELRARAASEPALWCDGTGPNDPPLSEDALALYTAGELASLLEGRRGVVMLQLHVGWAAHDVTPPYGPFKPLVLRLLREVLARPDIVSYSSAAPVAGATAGNASYGLTWILCADKEPFRSWGAHLAGFGCQAALEAQSPYYKLLIGRVLGYRPDHIMHHIKNKHGQVPSADVVAAVEQQLLKLSAKQPSLPWNASSRGGGRKKAK